MTRPLHDICSILVFFLLYLQIQLIEMALYHVNLTSFENIPTLIVSVIRLP